MNKWIALICLLPGSLTACSQLASVTSKTQTVPPKQEGRVSTAKAVRTLVDDLLPRSGRTNLEVGEIRDMGAFYVATIRDRQKKDVIRNELLVRKDGAAIPVYGVRVNGQPTKVPVDSSKKARGMVGIWLWRTGQNNLRVGAVSRIDLAFVVTVTDSEVPGRMTNQLVVREDGFLLPVGNGQTLIPRGSKLAGSFGWIDPIMEPTFDFFPDSLGWGEPDWDTGWWGSDWGWGWGSAGTWTEPGPNGGDGDDECLPEMDELQCFCLTACRQECRHTPLIDRCFEDCVDRCLLPVG